MFELSKIYHYWDIAANKASYSVSEIFSWLHIKVYLAILILQNISIWIFVYLFVRQAGQGLTILHYNADFGVDFVGDAGKLYAIPLLSLFISFFDLALLSVFTKRKDFRLISYLLLSAAVLANAFLSLALGPIYSANFR